MRVVSPFLHRLGMFHADRRGGIAVLSGIVFAALIGISGLVAEYGYGLVMKAQNQRVADLAAYAGALAYNAGGTTAAMTNAVSAITTLNGLASTAAAGTLGTSPSGDGNNAVAVTVATNTPLVLTAMIGGAGHTLTAGAGSSAEVTASTSPCVVALGSGAAGVTLAGGTKLTAPACGIASNASVSVPCGTAMTTISVSYNSATVPSQPCSGIQAPTGKSLSIKKATASDPLSGNSGVASATTHLSSVASMTAPAAPNTQISSTYDIDFGYSQSTTQASAKLSGCTASFSNNTWTLTCTASTVTFHNVTIEGGISLNFNTTGAAATTYNIGGTIAHKGSTAAFGPGTYNINGGITTSGGTTTTFAGGTFNIGQNTSSCNGAGRYSICHTGSTLTFSGTTTLALSSGIRDCGGAKMSLGTGSSNSYDLGTSSDGYALYVEGGSTMSFADATAARSVFNAEGHIRTSGGSCTTFPAAAEHDVLGNFSTAGGITLGSGRYSVTGYLGFGTDDYGNDSGGDVTCNGATVGVAGSGVTLVTAGGATPGSSGSCGGKAFCVAAGYGHVTLTAPTSGSMIDLCVIGPSSTKNAAGAGFTEGASATSISGAFYFPNGPIALSGGASVGGGRCLQIIGSQITLSGGSAAASNCPGLGSGTTGTGAKLVL